MTDAERLLLERLADAGKPTPLREDELLIAFLESSGLVMVITRAGEPVKAIILPKGRHVIASGEEKKQPKAPFGFR